MKQLKIITVSLALATALQGNVCAQIKFDEVDTSDIAGRLDLTVPQSSALTALGVTSENVVNGDNLRTVAATLLQGVDPSGNLQKGLALDIRPFMLFNGKNSSALDYKTHYLVRLASSAQFSFATTSGDSQSDKADRQALGANITLWSEADPAEGYAKLNYIKSNGTTAYDSIESCYTDYLKAASTAPIILPGVSAFAAAKAAEKSALEKGASAAVAAAAATAAATAAAAKDAADIKKFEEGVADKARLATTNCLEPFKKQRWNAGSLKLAAVGTRATDDDNKVNGESAWSSFSHSLGPTGQIIASFAYHNDRLMATADGSSGLSTVDEINSGLRLRFGNSRSTFMTEALWVKSSMSGQNDEYVKGSIGLEIMAAKDVWLQFTTGKSFSTHMFEDDVVYSGQVRFGFSEGSLLNP